nr:integrase, catalytic region, zinc finger, CCHC-type, peptidase aspartic, catalytic [Tanacetum cinerariifolium]
MMENLMLLCNFVEKFMGTVKFGNDQFALILVYGGLRDMCVLKSRNSVNSRTKMPIVVPVSTREPKRTVKQSVAKPLRKIVASESTNQKPRNITRKLYERIKIVLFIVDSGCLKHMTENLKLLINFVEKFLSTVKFGNDQIAPILGYRDLVQGAVTIKRVYYVEGLNHNLFSIGQFCDADLEVAFQKSTCYIRDLKGNDLLTCSRGTDLYSITLQDSTSPNPICLMAKAKSSQAWLWHRRLSYLNFDTINLLSKNDIVIGLPKLKFVKDHLCSSWILHQTSVARTPEQNSVVKRQNRTLVEAARTMLSVANVPLFFWAEAIATSYFTQNRSFVIPRHEKTPYHIINDQKPSKDETFEVLIDFLRLVQKGLHAQVRTVRTDKGTEFLNKTLHEYFSQEDYVNSDPAPQCLTTILERGYLSPATKSQVSVSQAAMTITMSLNELDMLFSLMFDEYFTRATTVVSKSSVIPTADASDKRQQSNTASSTSTTVAVDSTLLNIPTTV